MSSTRRRPRDRALRRLSALSILIVLLATGCGDSTPPAGTGDPAQPDPYLWLEDVDGAEALAWVADRNEHSLGRLESDPRFGRLYDEALALFEATDRIPYGSYFGGHVHNFWQDAEHVRGVWRRTTLDSYASDAPDWETVLDLDALAAEEGENWVWKGRSCLPPAYRRCLVRLSRGGGDAVVVREYDTEARAFVADGFVLPEAKSSIGWIDEDRVFVGTDFGPGSMTSSGYPRTVRVWTRGTPLDQAPQIAEGDTADVSMSGFTVFRPEGATRFLRRTPEFFRGELWWLDETLSPVKVPIQEDAEMAGLLGDRLLVRLRSDWTVNGSTFPAGGLVALRLAETMRTGEPTGVETVYAPSERGSIGGVSTARDAVWIDALEEVTGSLVRATPAAEGWRRETVALPENGSVGLVSADDWSDVVLATFQSFLVPNRLYLLRNDQAPRTIKTLPDRFDASGFVAEERFASSADGERIPYFVVRPKDLPANGTAPTLLYGYGGFEVSLKPSYASPGTIAWLKEGGVYVLANIRGGGEFGPRWHEAALVENRQRAYDDFIAVAEDLVASGITSPAHLGISGGSNGGLLVAAVTMQRPDLFGAVVCSVPLLDMLRYHKLLAGASWMAEYGNPDDPDDRAVIARYSPYQNVRPDVEYPEMFFWTNTRDDRVHPGHPRKMVARMMEQGHPVLYYENTEGGHSAGANLRQAARTTALTTVYLLQELSDPD